MSALTGFLFGIAVASIVWYAMIKAGFFAITPKGSEEFTQLGNFLDEVKKIKNKL